MCSQLFSKGRYLLRQGSYVLRQLFFYSVHSRILLFCTRAF